MLALDISARSTGWAYAAAAGEPVYGLWIMPGIADLGRVYAALRNQMEDAFAVHQPASVVFVPALHAQQTSARALLGLCAVAELACWDSDKRPYEVNEATVRKAVLGRGSFGDRGEGGRIIKGTGTTQAKAAAIAWCQSRGWQPQTHDVADALVLLEYARQHFTARAERFAA
jgi:hypothetical protein